MLRKRYNLKDLQRHESLAITHGYAHAKLPLKDLFEENKAAGDKPPLL